VKLARLRRASVSTQEAVWTVLRCREARDTPWAHAEEPTAACFGELRMGVGAATDVPFNEFDDARAVLTSGVEEGGV
jgi:hypothetical protein